MHYANKLQIHNLMLPVTCLEFCALPREIWRAREPNDEQVTLAAVALHDMIQTVVNEYAHLKKSDEFEVYNSYLKRVRAMV